MLANVEVYEVDLKRRWFAVFLHVPTHPKQGLPPKNIAFLRIFFSLNDVNKYFFKIIKSCILIKERLQIVVLYTAFVEL